MAFGLHLVRDAEKEKARDMKKILQEQSDDTPTEGTPSSAVLKAAPAPSAASRFARRPAPEAPRPTASATTGQQRPAQRPIVEAAAAPITPKTQNGFMKAKANFESDGDVTPDMFREDWTPNEFDDEADADKEEVSVFESENYGPTPQQLLGLRARRLAQEVGEFKKWSLDEILLLERRAVQDPRSVIDELLPVYKNEIQPKRDMGMASLSDALKKHETETVFLLVKGDKERVRVVAKGSGHDVLQGAVLRSCQFNTTPFEKPLYVLPKLFEKEAEPPSNPPKSTPSP